jgi:hypothetical protein
MGTIAVHGGEPAAAARPSDPPGAVAVFLRLSVILAGFGEYLYLAGRS